MNENELLKMWIAHCEGIEPKDESHFYGFLAGGWSNEELKQIFRYLPSAPLLIENLKKIYKAEPAVSKATPNELVSIILDFISSQTEYLLKRDIPAPVESWLRKVRQVRVVDQDEFREIRSREINGMFYLIYEQEDDFLDYTKEAQPSLIEGSRGDRAMEGVSEALYCIAADHYLEWFVLMPLLDTTIKYDKYFEFWSKGGEYTLTDTEIIIAQKE